MKSVIIIFLFLASCSSFPTLEREPHVLINHKINYSPVEKIAVIVEPREHPLLVPIVHNVIQMLGDDWKIQIFHSVTNEEYIQNSTLAPSIEAGKIYLSKMLIDNNISLGIYNSIMLDPYFWEKVLGEKVILFETDSVMCGSPQRQLSEFMERYDYVGAPWSHFRNSCYVSRDDRYGKWRVQSSKPAQSYSDKPVEFFEAQVGNSGFSYRSRTKTLEILSKYVPVDGNYYMAANDLFYACAFQHGASGARVPSVQEASYFSVENISRNAPIAVHKPWISLQKQDLERLELSCPEIKILKPYYLDKGDVWGR